jgi:hypothetical protein
MFKRIAFLVVLVLCLKSQAFAQSEAQIDYWRSAIETMPMDEIATRLSDPSLPRWPAITSSYACRELPEPQKQAAFQCLQLADAFRAKMVKQSVPKSDFDLAKIKADIGVYNSIGQALDQAGGYNNLLLADSLFRLAIYRISGLLVFQPESAPEVGQLIGSLGVPTVDVKTMLLKLGSQGSDVQPHLAGVRKIKTGDNLYKALQSAGINFDVAFNPSAKLTSSLIREPSVIGLIQRMAETESIVKVNLEGTVRFFELGGTYSELNPRDIRPFEARMDKEAKAYTYPLLQVRKFKETDVLYLIAMQKDDAVRSAWLDIVLK